MHSFIKGAKFVWEFVLGILFLFGVVFCVYKFGDHMLERTIGRCNGDPSAQTCNEGIDTYVCTCDQGYHFFWQQDPVAATIKAK